MMSLDQSRVTARLVPVFIPDTKRKKTGIKTRSGVDRKKYRGFSSCDIYHDHR